jgi:hypothetical protein
MNREERERLGGNKNLKRREHVAAARESAAVAFECFAVAFRHITNGCVAELACDCAYENSPCFIQDSFACAEAYADRAIEFLKKAHRS